MARRPAGLKATPAGGASAAPNIPAGSKQPRVPAGSKQPRVPAGSKQPRAPAGSKQPKPAARPKPSPNPEPPEPPASPRPKPAPAAQRPEPSPRPGLTPLVALRLSAAALALEALGLAIAAVFAVVSTVGGHAYQLAGGIAAILIALATASGLGGIAVCLATARAWTRIPTALTQVFVIIAGITLLQGHRLEWGVPALALAVTCLAGLLTPASLRALNRPPIEPAKNR